NLPPALAQTPFWNVRFASASNYVFTLLPTVGLVGFLFWILLVALIAAFSLRTLFREEHRTTRLLVLAAFVPWLSLVVAKFLYSTTISLEFFFWFLTALLFVGTSRKFIGATFSSSPRALLGTSFGAVLCVVFMLILVLLAGSRALAWSHFGSAVRANAAGDVAQTRDELIEASNTDPRTDIFVRNLAQVRLFEAGRAASVEELRASLNTAVSAAQRAVAIAPANPANWYMLGVVFREMTPAVTGAGDRAIDAFEKARALEPRNPVYPTEMGRIRITLADAARAQTQSKDEVVKRTAEAQVSEQLAQALQLLQEAVTLKSDYAPAHFYIAMIFARQGKLNDAIAKLEALKKTNPRDVGLAFQLGVLYIENKDLVKAEAELKRALEIAPSYANARWYLASIYESRGDLEEAIKQVEAILAVNPENQVVQNRLADLKKGRSAKELPPPVTNEGAELTP
ncbi:MAG: tetratricopeptide repeat protein, partial [bacterium]|nr:tetratricopeptide repeat protein [bacterium]